MIPIDQTVTFDIFRFQTVTIIHCLLSLVVIHEDLEGRKRLLF